MSPNCAIKRPAAHPQWSVQEGSSDFCSSPEFESSAPPTWHPQGRSNTPGTPWLHTRCDPDLRLDRSNPWWCDPRLGFSRRIPPVFSSSSLLPCLHQQCQGTLHLKDHIETAVTRQKTCYCKGNGPIVQEVPSG